MSDPLPSGLPELVADEEDLARFLTSSRLFSAETVKSAAFMPNSTDGRTSVFRHGRELSESLWRIGSFVAGDRTLRGAAIIKARDIRDARLDVLASEPPPRHADIVGWPWSATDPELGKAERKEQAILIAAQAQLLRYQTGSDAVI